jgi:Colicin D
MVSHLIFGTPDLSSIYLNEMHYLGVNTRSNSTFTGGARAGAVLQMGAGGLLSASAGAGVLDAAAAEEGAAASDLPELSAARSQLEAKFYHAPDFGVTEPRGAAGFEGYGKAVNSFVNDTSTIRTVGTYRGNRAILNYNPESQLVVVQSPSGEFVSGWQMSEQQLLNVMERGSIGGG